MSLWGKPASGNGGWSILTTQCVDPAEVPTQQRALTAGDVLSADPPDRPPRQPKCTDPPSPWSTSTPPSPPNPRPSTAPSTSSATTSTSTSSPPRYTWTWGDGTTTTTTTPGRPYPATDITHTYHPRHPTTTQRSTSASRSSTTPATASTARTGSTIDDPITIDGPTHPLPIKQASAVLVQPGE